MLDIPGRWKETSDFSPSPILSLVSVCTVQGPRHLVLMDSCPTTMAKDIFSEEIWLLG